ncbi:YhfH family protein [Ectobacillus sp. JY-23]|nr:protein YhfH [Ectobacillus sp. JY-23]UOY92074.1 YhfH family protein [Ectobacillus sp. JY-23]
MLQNPMEFFRNLPPKNCCKCGKEIDEQHEAYHNQCEDCIHTGEC